MVCGVSFMGLELACTLTLHTAVRYIGCSGEPLAGTTIIIVTQMLHQRILLHGQHKDVVANDKFLWCFGCAMYWPQWSDTILHKFWLISFQTKANSGYLFDPIINSNLQVSEGASWPVLHRDNSSWALVSTCITVFCTWLSQSTSIMCPIPQTK